MYRVGKCENGMRNLLSPRIEKEKCALDLPGGMIIPRVRTFPSQIQIFFAGGRPMTAFPCLIRLASAILALAGGLAPLAASSPVKSPSEADLAAQVDSLIEEKCREQQVKIAPIASDAEFLRRAHLDFIGTIPTVGEARAFLEEDLPGLIQEHMTVYCRHQILLLPLNNDKA